MLVGYEKKSSWGVVGLIVVFGSAFTAGFIKGYTGEVSSLVDNITMVAALAGAVVFFYGLWCYSVGKGYSGLLAFLILLGIIGLVILLLLPDKYKVDAKVEPDGNPRGRVAPGTCPERY